MVSSIISAAGSLIGSNESANAAKDAGSEQQAAGNQAAALTQQQYATQQAQMAPWLQAGTGAVNSLADLTGVSGNTGAAGYGSLTQPFTAADFVADPGYQFSLDQGQKALERSAAAKGGLLSGAAIKAAQTYGQGTAAQEYDDVYNRYNTNQTNIYNRLAGLSGTGQTTANQLGTAGANATSAANNYTTSGTAANAAGQVGAANAYTTGLNSVGSTLGNFFSGSSTSGSSGGNLGGVDPATLSTVAGTFF